MISWWLAQAEALRAGDSRTFKKLYEAGLSCTIKMRVAANITQIVMDSFTWSEQMYLLEVASRDSLVNVTQKCLAVPAFQSCFGSEAKLLAAINGKGLQ